MGYKYNYKNDQYRDGEYGTKVLANSRNDQLREGSGTRAIVNVRGDDIRDGSGTRVVCNVRGDDIREGSGTRVVGKISKDVTKSIKNSSGSRMDVAFWYKFCK